MQDEPDDEFLLRENFLRGISLLKKYNLTYDILIYPKHLKVAKEFVAKFPDQPFVIDHIAKPFIKDHIIGDWEQGMRVGAGLGCDAGSGGVSERVCEGVGDGDGRKLVEVDRGRLQAVSGYHLRCVRRGSRDGGIGLAE